MARKPKKKAKKTSGSPRKPVSGSRRRWWLLIPGVLSVIFLAYLGYLNYLINDRFDGDTWVLPSRVFSRALELYPGLALDAEALEYELKLSSYLPVAQDPAAGQFRRLGNSLEIFVRAFDFADEPQAARKIQVFFKSGVVDALVDSETSRELDLFRMPPVMLGSYYPDSGEDRLLLNESQIPQRLIEVLIAVEDHRFYEHFGVSPKAILRALWANIKAGRAVQGGSTLTQQLAKNMFLTPEKSLLRKINEAFMSLLLELRFSKQTILAAYINEVFLLQQNRIWALLSLP